MGLMPARQVAVDLGSSSTRVYDPRRRRLLTAATRGVRHGAIVDPAACSQALRPALRDTTGIWRAAAVTVSVPTDRRAAYAIAADTVRSAGAREVCTVEQALAAAIGAGIDISESPPEVLVDVGAGLPEVAVVGHGRVLAQDALPWGAHDLAEALAEHLREVDAFHASATECARALRTGHVTGREGDGTWRTMPLGRTRLHALLHPAATAIKGSVVTTLDNLPTPLAGDVITGGVVFVGGGSGTVGLADRLAAALRMPVRRPRDPAGAVVAGLAAMVGGAPPRVTVTRLPPPPPGPMPRSPRRPDAAARGISSYRMPPLFRSSRA